MVSRLLKDEARQRYTTELKGVFGSKEVKNMKLTGAVKENKIVLPEGINLPEGAVIELVVPDAKDYAPNKDDVAEKTLELSEEAKHSFWKLIGAGDSGKSDVSANKHRYLSEALDERPIE